MYSQRNEEDIVNCIFNILNIENKDGKLFSVEFGAGDGIKHSNTRLLLENGWYCLFIEGDPLLYQKLLYNTRDCKNAVEINRAVSIENDNSNLNFILSDTHSLYHQHY